MSTEIFLMDKESSLLNSDELEVSEESFLSIVILPGVCTISPDYS